MIVELAFSYLVPIVILLNYNKRYLQNQKTQKRALVGIRYQVQFWETCYYVSGDFSDQVNSHHVLFFRKLTADYF